MLEKKQNTHFITLDKKLKRLPLPPTSFFLSPPQIKIVIHSLSPPDFSKGELCLLLEVQFSRGWGGVETNFDT